MNCTLVPGLDRCPNTGGKDRSRPLSPVQDVLLYEGSGWVDTFRSLHPRDGGHTRDKARLDYVFAKIPLGMSVSACRVDPSFPALSLSDHCGVICDIAVPDDAQPRVRLGGTRSIPNVHRASASQLVAFRKRADEMLKAVHGYWLQARADLPADERGPLLGRVQRDFALAIVDSAKAAFPPAGMSRRDQRKVRLRRLITAIATAARAVKRGASGHLAHTSRTLQQARTALYHSGAHPGLAPTDESAWLEWADGEAACAIAQHKARLS